SPPASKRPNHPPAQAGIQLRSNSLLRWSDRLREQQERASGKLKPTSRHGEAPQKGTRGGRRHGEYLYLMWRQITEGCCSRSAACKRIAKNEGSWRRDNNLHHNPAPVSAYLGRTPLGRKGNSSEPKRRAK